MNAPSAAQSEKCLMPAAMPIYLDNHATTRMDPRVLEAMKPYFCDVFGNPASRSHPYGYKAQAAVEKARRTIAEAVGAALESEVVFLSGATEANNLALRGVMAAARHSGKNHLITTPVEHKSVLETCSALKAEGVRVTFLSIRRDGSLNLDELRRCIGPETALISVMHANNEIGTIYPLSQIGEIAHAAGVLFHTDAVQTFGKLPINVQEMGIHLLSVSAHKLYGPKGTGALYVRRLNPRVAIRPIVTGGAQEGGLRAGTLAVPLIVGFGAAVELALAEMQSEQGRLARLRDELLRGLAVKCPGMTINGTMTARLPNNLNVNFPGINHASLMFVLKARLAVSHGSACAGNSARGSYVLEALGLEPELCRGAIRFGLGRFTTAAEIAESIQIVSEAAARVSDPAFQHPSDAELKASGCC